jgi:glycine/betaine/sarcosine/D-proline reductase family selenoprotein B
MKKAVLYINQFFAGIGGEDQANLEPEMRPGVVGSGMALQAALDGIEITHTLICGDNYIGTHDKEAIERILSLLETIEFDLLFAGPAFQAGRYGFACGLVCKRVRETFGVPVFSSMNEENPGTEMFHEDFPIFIGGRSAAAMRKDCRRMGRYASRLMRGEPLEWAEKEGYFGRGIRKQIPLDPPVPAARRAVEMLTRKMAGEPYVTELPVPPRSHVPIAPPIKDLTQATLAVITTGGIVPVDNPDRIQSASATRWGSYDISSMDRLEAGRFKTIHAGFDPYAANTDPNVIVPLDVLRAMEKEHVFKRLHSHFFSTVGTGTTQAEAERMGREMLVELRRNHVDGVLMVST